MRLRLLVSESIRSLGANLSTTVAATMTVLIGMFLLGLFIALGSWVVSWSDHVKRDLMVKVFFVENANERQFNTLQAQLDADPRMKAHVVVTKADALKRMREKFPELTENLPSNPLPASIEVVPNRAEDVEAIANSLRPLPAGVEEVTYGKQAADRLLRVARVIEIVFLAAVLVLLIAAALLTAHTIRLSSLSRRRALGVLRPVHARGAALRPRPSGRRRLPAPARQGARAAGDPGPDRVVVGRGGARLLAERARARPRRAHERRGRLGSHYAPLPEDLGGVE